MTALPTHTHISEREPDGTWEDCTFDSGLEFYRDAIDPSVPATHTEAHELRKVSGRAMTGGTNLGDFRKAVAARYHRTLPPAISNKGILTALKPGMVAAVQGSMSAFGPTHPLSRWDRNFDGSHQVWLARDPNGTLLWCDPEAPTTADVPVIISPADVQKFVNAFAGEAIVAPALKWAAAQGATDNMRPIIRPLLGQTARIKAKSNIRVEPVIAAQKVRTTTADSVVTGLVGYVKGDVDPANGKTDWLGWLEAGQWRFTAVDNVLAVSVPVPTDDGYTKATQDDAVAAAVAKQKADDQAAIAAAAAAERERLAQVEADRIRRS